MDQNIQKKLAELQTLLAQQKAIEGRIAEILSPEEKLKIIIPSGFSLNSEVLKFIQEAGDAGIAVVDLTKKIQTKFPEYGMDRKKIASAVAYLKNTKKQIESAGRSLYRFKNQNAS